MKTRRIGQFEVAPIGLGCMGLSHAYGSPPAKDDAVRLLRAAVNLGYTLIDTAALYGFGANEELIGEALSDKRGDFVLASKCGMFKGPDGKRKIDGRPEVLKQTCEDALKRLKTDVIDLYYLHRWDKAVPLEDSVGALSDLVKEGKVREIGLSEVSAETLRKAHAVHPVAAVQNEYSLWSRNAEIAVLGATKELGAALVCFSPLGRGYLTGRLKGLEAMPEGDIRRNMPRFQPETYEANLRLLDALKDTAREHQCTMGQAALAWLLARGEHVVPIPGTTNPQRLEENFAACEIELGRGAVERLDAAFDPEKIAGSRYPAATQAEIDTEQFAFEQHQ